MNKSLWGLSTLLSKFLASCLKTTPDSSFCQYLQDICLINPRVLFLIETWQNLFKQYWQQKLAKYPGKSNGIAMAWKSTAG